MELKRLKGNYKKVNEWWRDYTLNFNKLQGRRLSRKPENLPPEEVGVPQSNTTPCPSRTDTALLVWTLK